METAINDWFQKTGDAVDSNGEAIEDASVFAGLVGIPYHTLYKYIHPEEGKRRILGNGERGRQKLLDNDDVQFLGETLARLDRCNDGASKKEGTEHESHSHTLICICMMIIAVPSYQHTRTSSEEM